jgi:hypothetical protein
MPTFNYGRTKASADRLIARCGADAVLRVPGTATGPRYDPTPGASVDHPIRVVVTGYSARERDGTSILATDKKVLIAVGDLAVEPLPSHKLVLGGVEHRILGKDEDGEGVVKVSPGGVTVLYKAHARR